MSRNEGKLILDGIKIIDKDIAKACPRIYDIVITNVHRKDTNDRCKLDFISCLNDEGKHYLAKMTIVYRMDVFGVEIEFELENPFTGFEQYVEEDFYSNNSIIRNHVYKYIRLIKGFRYEPRYVVIQKDEDSIWNAAGYNDDFDACNPKYLDELTTLFDRYKKFKYKTWNMVVLGVKNIVNFCSMHSGSVSFKIKRYDENRDNVNIRKPKVEPIGDDDE